MRQLGWESIPCIMTKNSISSNHPITVCATFEYLNQFSENYIGMMQISNLLKGISSGLQPSAKPIMTDMRLLVQVVAPYVP